MKKNALLFLLFILLFSFNCKRYPDGPLISLRTPEKRLKGEWQISKILKNGTDFCASGNNCHLRDPGHMRTNFNYDIYFSSDGTFTFLFYLNNFSLLSQNLFSQKALNGGAFGKGTWKLINHKNELELDILDSIGSNNKITFKIYRLITNKIYSHTCMRKEMVLVSLVNADLFEFHFKEVWNACGEKR